MSNPTIGQEEREPAFLGRSPHSESIGVHRRAFGPVVHLDAESLRRPIELPHHEYKRLYLIVAAAAILAFVLVGWQIFSNFVERAGSSAKVSEIVEAAGKLSLPSIQSMAGLGNEEIYNYLVEAGYDIYDNTSEEDVNANGFDYVLITKNSDADTVAAAYETGISSLSSPDAAKQLVGSWRLLMDRSNGVELRLRYADFASTTPEKAIATALGAQDLSQDSESKPTPDNMGNTNLSGTFSKDGTDYNYTISVCDLAAIYDVEGLPSDAQYVSFKLTW